MYNYSRTLNSSDSINLPEPIPNRHSMKYESSAIQKCSRYLHRLFRVGHMDFEFAVWQMIYLFVSPKKVLV